MCNNWIFKASVGVFLIFIISASVSAQNFRNVVLNSEITKVQPMTGIVFWTDNNADLATLGDRVQLEFSYLVYSDVVSKKGVYNWSVVDQLLAKAADRAHQVILRFRHVYPGVTAPSVPQYILDLDDYTMQNKKVENSVTFIPDWSNKELQRFTKEFYTKFAARYDTDPRIAFLQIGFGSYSEYHLFDGPFELGTTFPSKAYQTEFLKHVDKQFPITQWAISIDAADQNHTPIKENTSLKNLNYGVFDDSFLHKKHSITDDEYNRASWRYFGTERANTAVAGGEFSYFTTYDQEHVLDLPNGPHGTSFEDLATLYNISYIIGNDQLKYQPKNRIKNAGMHTGYRFKVTSFKTNGNLTEVIIKNEGIAPIYYDAYPTVNGIRSETSLKGMAKGQSKTFTILTEATNESLTITSDRLVPGQKIEFEARITTNTLSVSDFGTQTDYIQAYPNPFRETLTFTNDDNKLVEIVLRDVQGRTILTKTIAQNFVLQTAELKSGLYLVTVTFGNQKKTAVFIKK